MYCAIGYIGTHWHKTPVVDSFWKRTPSGSAQTLGSFQAEVEGFEAPAV